jgi:predicted HicB family RNase H-like nuclease
MSVSQRKQGFNNPLALFSQSVNDALKETKMDTEKEERKIGQVGPRMEEELIDLAKDKANRMGISLNTYFRSLVLKDLKKDKVKFKHDYWH